MNKKLLIVLPILALSTGLSACSSAKLNQKYEEAMASGKSNITKEEYYDAIIDFSSALECKEGDQEAENLIEQLELLIDAKNAKDNNDYSGEIENLDKINSIKTNDKCVKNKANEYRKEAEEFTIDEAKVKVEEELDMPLYNSSKDYEKSHESYISVKEPAVYFNGEKAYMATAWWYEKDDDFWMHQNVYVFKDRIE